MREMIKIYQHRPYSIPIVAVYVMWFGILMGCQSAEKETPKYIDQIGPSASVVELDDAKDVSRNPMIKFLFSEPMDRESVESSFSLYAIDAEENAIASEIPITFSDCNVIWNANLDVVSFQPIDPLKNIAMYHATIGTTALDLTGNALIEPLSFNFSTLDDTPSVISLSPSNGSVGIEYESEIIVKFSHLMDKENVEKAFRFTGKTGVVTGSFEWNVPYGFSFYPSTTLDNYANYNVDISSIATGRLGTPLRDPYTGGFRTKGTINLINNDDIDISLGQRTSSPIVITTAPINATVTSLVVNYNILRRPFTGADLEIFMNDFMIRLRTGPQWQDIAETIPILDNFEGYSVNGTWNLQVDHISGSYFGYAGTINSWDITITY